MIRVGKVSSINPKECSARVAFEDRSDVVSFELPILVRGSIGTLDYWMPAPGEQVVCLFLPSGAAQGFILGAFYSESDPPPVKDAAKRHITFPDGTTIEYDATTHILNIQAAGQVKIQATGDVHVIGDVIADGISLKKHTHGGISSGSESSGPPIGGA
ncbi:phage baseplate assembly protein V [Paenibacillus ehimensis]|uniref:phage baseplate assembly protein V n=1 Tax=Paenibacillus ehimensis TaxID=79264 RepID=UPI00046ED53C|nr:phage baseplate assembly protein V [Paenibacillus ehimensis]